MDHRAGSTTNPQISISTNDQRSVVALGSSSTSLPPPPSLSALRKKRKAAEEQDLNATASVPSSPSMLVVPQKRRHTTEEQTPRLNEGAPSSRKKRPALGVEAEEATTVIEPMNNRHNRPKKRAKDYRRAVNPLKRTRAEKDPPEEFLQPQKEEQRAQEEEEEEEEEEEQNLEESRRKGKSGVAADRWLFAEHPSFNDFNFWRTPLPDIISSSEEEEAEEEEEEEEEGVIL